MTAPPPEPEAIPPAWIDPALWTACIIRITVIASIRPLQPWMTSPQINNCLFGERP